MTTQKAQSTRAHTCSGCAASRDSKILPRGWHRSPDGGLFCAKCWSARYILRAVAIPIAGPVDGDWKELREAMKTCWRAATRLSNWAVTELAKADFVRTADMEKIPAPPRVYLYPDARAMVPEIDAGSVVSILHAVEGKYRTRRCAVLWWGSESLPNYRYPTPYPVRAQDWSALLGQDNVPLVSVRLAGRRWTLRLRGGREFHRQLAAHRQIVDGTALAAELSLYEQRANHSDHRNGLQVRDKGGQQYTTRLMCKMVAWLPRSPKPPSAEGTFYVRTDSDALLIGLNAKDERLWTENCDQVRRWSAEHARRLQRWADDSKAESRPVPALSSRREAAAIKYRHRMESACHQIAAHVVGYARRRKFATLKYDDTDKSYCVRFPWEMLRRLIGEKADAAGIAFEWSSGEKTAGTARGNAKEDE